MCHSELKDYWTIVAQIWSAPIFLYFMTCVRKITPHLKDNKASIFNHLLQNSTIHYCSVCGD